MLDILRANARSALTYILFGIIILVFIVSFGPGSCGGRSGRDARESGGEISGDAATVNGETISVADFEQHYAQLYRSYQRQAGEGFSRELADRLGLRRVALDQLVERTLVRQAAQREGIVVGDEDVERAVKDNPAFQSNGRFDYDGYQRAVANAYGSPSRFEARLREDIAVQRMVALLRQGVKVSDTEVHDAWLSENDRMNLELVRFPLAQAREEAKVSDADAQAFLAASGDRVKKQYEADKAKYDKPKRVKARHLLVKAEEGAPAAQADAAKKKAEGAADRAKKGDDFAKLAQELSDDVGTKDRGGELGWFGTGVMAKPFEDAAFAAKKGEVVGPVQTRFGFHVIQVEDVQEPQSSSYDAAKLEVSRELLASDRAKDVATKRAQAALAAAKAGRSLAELFPADEKAKGAVHFGGQPLRAEETGSFTASAGAGSIPRVGPAPQLLAAALTATSSQLLDRVFETPDGPVVARVKERSRPDATQFEARKNEVSERLRGERERQIEQAWVKSLRDQGKVKLNEQLAGGPGLASLGE